MRAAQFVRCRRGSVIAEFALAAPLIFLAATMVIELALMMFVSSLIEGGLREAARFGITGFTPPSLSREEKIRQIVADNTIGLVDMTAASITQHVYASFGDIGKPEPFTDQAPLNGVYDPSEPFQDINGNGQWDADMGTAGVGGPGDIVLYTIAADWRPLTPLVAPLFGSAGKVRLKASVAVRNEPYGSGGAQ